MNYLAIDLGAGSGRGIIGSVKNGKIDLKEIHRFMNQPVRIGESYHWNLPSLLMEIKTTIQKALKEEPQISGIGIDTWGVDYGLLDAQGKLIGIPYSYRDHRTDGIFDDCFRLCSKEDIFRLTGNQLMEINTAFQLFSQKKNNDPQLTIAEHLLFMPDLLNYLLTGKMANEYTIASTSQLLHAGEKKWAIELFKKLDIPRKLMEKIVYPGTVIGQLSNDICAELGCQPIDVIAVGSHDTASALAAVPVDDDKNWAFISSGTWSLMGVEIEAPIFSDEALQNDFTNEGAVNGGILFLRNITGLWILQQVIHEWRKMDITIDYESLIEEAETLPQQAIIDVDASDFHNPSSMIEAIVVYCKKTQQKKPETTGEFMRCIVDSLAHKYNSVAKSIEVCTKQKIEQIHIVGGGCQNNLLNQLIADTLEVEVVAGPVEATALGNILAQAIAKGDISSLQKGRQIIHQSVELKIFKPQKRK
jgi:rhamnulokinase